MKREWYQESQLLSTKSIARLNHLVLVYLGRPSKDPDTLSELDPAFFFEAIRQGAKAFTQMFRVGSFHPTLILRKIEKFHQHGIAEEKARLEE